MADYIDRDKLKEDSEYNPVSGEYLSYSRGQIWNASIEKVIDISVLDKAIAEIERVGCVCHASDNYDELIRKNTVLKILNKYKAESEEV